MQQQSPNHITFKQFQQVCREVADRLNEQDYSAAYNVKKGMLIREHDAEYLDVECKSQGNFLKINILYSLAYQMPQIYFMVYDSEGKPMNSANIYEKYMMKDEREKAEFGIFFSQNPITQEQMFTLHGCRIDLQPKLLILFYLSLFKKHPEI